MRAYLRGGRKKGGSKHDLIKFRKSSGLKKLINECSKQIRFAPDKNGGWRLFLPKQKKKES